MMTDTTLSRRQFVATALTAGGGFALGIGILAPAEAATLSVRPWNDDTTRYPGEINAWVVIQPDDTVIIRYGRAEMGQGSFTALPQILAEELECDWALVKPEYASANRNIRENKVYGSLSTGGSRAVRETGEIVQQAGASARERLIAAAAKRWNVPNSESRTSPRGALSVLASSPSGRPRSSLTRSRRSSGRISTSSSAGGSRGWTCRSRSMARRNTASIWKCPAWCGPRFSNAPCSVAL